MGQIEKEEERFLSSQADRLAGARLREKASAYSVRNDGSWGWGGGGVGLLRSKLRCVGRIGRSEECSVGASAGWSADRPERVAAGDRGAMWKRLRLTGRQVARCILRRDWVSCKGQ